MLYAAQADERTGAVVKVGPERLVEPVNTFGVAYWGAE
jgi:hypothetical protein